MQFVVARSTFAIPMIPGVDFVQTRRHGNGWILVTDSTWTDTTPTGGTQERSMTNMHEAFKSWTGDAWGTQVAAAKFFTTEKAAEDYMKQFANTLDMAKK